MDQSPKKEGSVYTNVSVTVEGSVWSLWECEVASQPWKAHKITTDLAHRLTCAQGDKFKATQDS
jgi:hypothetical protein